MGLPIKKPAAIRRILKAPDVARVRALLRYNGATGALHWRDTGRRADAGGGAGYPYRRVTFDGVRYQAHRIIWLMRTGDWPTKGEVDHRNGDGFDNRWSNLRDASRLEQCQNTQGKFRTRKSLKWVRVKPDGKFQATVQLYLGTYRTALEAHNRARKFVRQFHGPFLNAGPTK